MSSEEKERLSAQALVGPATDVTYPSICVESIARNQLAFIFPPCLFGALIKREGLDLKCLLGALVAG